MRMREQQINPHLFPLAPTDCSNHIMKQQRGSVFPLFNTKVACFATTHGRQTRPKFIMKQRKATPFTCEREAHEDAKFGPSTATHSAGHNAKFELSFDCRSVCPTDSQQVSSKSHRVRKKLSSCTTIVVRIKVEQSTHTALDRRSNLHAEVWRTLTCSVTSVALHLRDERDRKRRHIDQRARHREHGNLTSPCAHFSIQVCPHHSAATLLIHLGRSLKRTLSEKALQFNCKLFFRYANPIMILQESAQMISQRFAREWCVVVLRTLGAHRH